MSSNQCRFWQNVHLLFFRWNNESRSFLVASFPLVTHWFICQCFIYYLTQLFSTPLSSVYLIKKLLNPLCCIEWKYSFMHSFSLSWWSMASPNFGHMPCSRIVIQISFTTEIWCVCDKAGMFHSIYELIKVIIIISYRSSFFFTLRFLNISALWSISHFVHTMQLQVTKLENFPDPWGREPRYQVCIWEIQTLLKSLPALYFCNKMSQHFIPDYCTLKTFDVCVFQGWA